MCIIIIKAASLHVLPPSSFFLHPRSNLKDNWQKHAGDFIVGPTRTIHSDISITAPLISTGRSKSAKFALDFLYQPPLTHRGYETKKINRDRNSLFPYWAAMIELRYDPDISATLSLIFTRVSTILKFGLIVAFNSPCRSRTMQCPFLFAWDSHAKKWETENPIHNADLYSIFLKSLTPKLLSSMKVEIP